ncbi:MAG: hypothetical protein HC880_04415 [Bacteroidia bacterium]|nr:hypothetical protein [Bacteroidia bacterium]
MIRIIAFFFISVGLLGCDPSQREAQHLTERIAGEWQIDQIIFTDLLTQEDSVVQAPIGKFFFQKCKIKDYPSGCPGYYEVNGQERVHIGVGTYYNQLFFNILTTGAQPVGKLNFVSRYDILTLTDRDLVIARLVYINGGTKSYDLTLQLKRN